MSADGRQQYTDADLKQSLRRLADDLGRPPTTCEYQQAPVGASEATLRKRFGSWEAAVAAAGLDPDDIPRSGGYHGRTYDEDEMVAELQRVASDLGRPPTTTEFDDAETEPGRTAYHDRFGSWEQALEACGLDPDAKPDNRGGDGAPQQYSDEELLEWLDSFVQAVGVVPTGHDLRDWPGPHARTYWKRFGSVAKAVREAGYEPRGEIR